MNHPEQSGDERLLAVEHLLEGAAGWEADEPEPGFLSAGGVALLLADDAARRQRRTVRTRMAAFAGFFAGAAACSATLVMALTRPVAPPAGAGTPLVQQAPAVEPSATTAVEPTHGPVQLVAATKPERRHRVRRAHRRLRPAAPIWTNETVEREVVGVLAAAWVVEPQEDGAYQLTPALLDLPVDPAAIVSCLPVEAVPAPAEANPKPTPEDALKNDSTTDEVTP